MNTQGVGHALVTETLKVPVGFVHCNGHLLSVLWTWTLPSRLSRLSPLSSARNIHEIVFPKIFEIMGRLYFPITLSRSYLKEQHSFLGFENLLSRTEEK